MLIDIVSVKVRPEEGLSVSTVQFGLSSSGCGYLNVSTSSVARSKNGSGHIG